MLDLALHNIYYVHYINTQLEILYIRMSELHFFYVYIYFSSMNNEMQNKQINLECNICLCYGISIEAKTP